MTPKEIFLEMLKPGGQIPRQLKQYEALHLVLTDPINRYLRGNRVKGSVSKAYGRLLLRSQREPSCRHPS